MSSRIPLANARSISWWRFLLPIPVVRKWWPDRVDWAEPAFFWRKWFKAPTACKIGRHEYDEFEWETNCSGVVYYYCARCGQQPAWEVPIDDAPGHTKSTVLRVLRSKNRD